ncbi:unnamed protein product [Heterobilharzia americana]|nr:unnamed protein product [Heterobilharzia americana]
MTTKIFTPLSLISLFLMYRKADGYTFFCFNAHQILFNRIGNSKTVSDLNDPMLKNVSYSETSESSTLLSKKQIRRLSVPEYQISTNHLTPSTLITDIQNDSLLLAKKTPSNHSSGQYRSCKAAHINSHSMWNNDSSLSKVLSPCMLNSRNTVRVNPYCPPPDINPPPLPPRVGYSTPSVISPQSHHSKPIKYRPLPETPKTSCTSTATTIANTSIPKQSMQKKSSYSIPMSVTSPPSSTCINQISDSIVPTSLIQTTQPTLPANSKKSNSCHDNQKHHHRQCGYVMSIPDTTRHHRHREGQYSSNQNAVHPDCCVESQTPAVYINSRHASKQPKKTAPSPHRSRSTHSHSSSNNNSVTAPNSILFYQAPLPSSHSSVSSSRRHRLQEHGKSDGHSKNRLLVTMPEASLITSQPVDKLITPRRSNNIINILFFNTTNNDNSVFIVYPFSVVKAKILFTSLPVISCVKQPNN